MAKKKRSGAYSRRKGHSFERAIAIELRALGFTGARRQLEYHEADANGVDIQGALPFLFQLKKCKNYVSVNTIKEIQDDDPLKIPVLITAGDNLPAMAVVSWENLKTLIRAFLVDNERPDVRDPDA